MIARVLGLGIDSHGSAAPLALVQRELDHLPERGNLEQAIELLRPEEHSLHGAQGLDLGQGEVIGEPTLLRDPVDGFLGLASGELRVLGDIGRQGDVDLMACDQHPVLGRDQIGLDEVGPLPDREAIGFERVLGQVAARAAMADDERRGACESRKIAARLARHRGTDEKTDKDQ